MAKIFISHSSRNEQEAIAVRDWLVSNGWDDVFLDLDPKRGLAPGEHWQEALKAAAERCQAVLFLISADWLQSRWCGIEFGLAKMLGKPVFPILIKDVDRQELPSEMTAVHQLVDLVRDPYGWERLKEGLRRAVPEPETFRFAKGQPPYPGFEPLREDDAAIFFGREAQIVRGLDRLRVMSDAGAERALVILGASGAGKSSFLRAGLWPRLRRDDRNFLPLPVIRPERGVINGSYGLLAALEAAVSDPRVSKQPGVAGLPRSSGGIREMLESEETGLSRFFAALRRASAAGMLSPADAPLPTIVICVDQGEELLNEEGHVESKQFLAWLSQSLNPEEQTLLILAVRSDAYPRLQDKPLYSSLKPTPFDLPPMPVGSLRLVVEGPARVVDPPLKLEPQLVEALVTDASQPNSLPLLAFTLGRLYKAYGAEGGLTLAQYEKLGRISGAVQAAVNDAISQGKKKGVLPDDDAQIKQRLREAFIPHLARVNRAGLFLRRVATLEEMPAHALPIIDLFVEQHLLVKDRPSPSEVNPAEAREVVEVAHEALLREWPDLKSWLDADREFLAFKDDLERDIAIWGSVDDKQKTGALLSGLKLSKAQDWLFKRPQDLTEPERAYIRQSIDNEESHRRRTQNLWIGAGLVLATVALAALSAAWFAHEARDQAEKHLNLARDTLKVQVKAVTEDLQTDAGIQNKTLIRLLNRTESSFEALLSQLKDNARFGGDRAEMLGDYGVAYVVNGDISKAESRFEESLKQFRELLKKAPSELEWRRGVAEQLDQLGQTHAKQNKNDRARGEYEESLQLREGIAKDAPDDWRTYRDIASSQYDFGGYFLSSQPQIALERLRAAQDNTDKALTLVKNDDKGLEDLHRRKARVLVSLSEVYHAFKQKKEQKVALGDALEIRKNLYDSNHDNVEIRRDLSWTYQFLGNLAYEDGDFNSAEQYYQESFKLRHEASTNDPSDYRAKSDLAWAALNYGNVLRRLNRYNDARQQLTVASDLMREVAYQDKSNLVRRKDFCMSRVSLGDLEMDLLQSNKALDYYREASEIFENLIKMSDDPLFRVHLGGVYAKTGTAMLLAGNLSGAAEAFDKALQLRNPSYSKQHDGVEFQTELAQAHCSLGELQAKLDERSSARASYLECKELASGLQGRDEKPPIADRLLDQATKALKALPEGAAERGKGKHPSKF
jgi:tetratricopeptide (TPR) repeat protein